MFFLEVENEFGRKLQLTQNESNYQVLKVDGLTPPKAEIVTIRLAMEDGEKFKSSHVDMRNIVLTIRIRGNVERNRILLYEFFSVGAKSRIHYWNGTRNVAIEGYCENMDGDLFENGQTMQVSLVCPDPYWRESPAKTFDLSYNQALFEFPFSIDSYGVEFGTYNEFLETTVVNEGDVEAGFIWTVEADGGSVVNPVLYNVVTRDSMKVSVTIADGEVLIINTNKGRRSAIVRRANGTDVNLLNSISTDSKWLQVPRHGAVFTFNADSGKNFMNTKIEIENRYKGV